MQRVLSTKILIIAFLGLLLLIPLEMIEEQIRDRSKYRDSARRDIADSWTGQQKIMGPVLVVPYSLNVTERVWDQEDEEYRSIERIEKKLYALVPDTLNLHVKLETERRHRGIFSVPVYTGTYSIDGKFDLDPIRKLADREGFRHYGRPFLSVHITDPRGFTGKPALYLDDSRQVFSPGSNLAGPKPGIHAVLGKDIINSGNNSFNMTMQVRGMEKLAIIPAGRNTVIEIKSPWPHPAFSGHYLPRDYSVTADGFRAEWQLGRFASGIERQMEDCIAGRCQALLSNTLDVSLIDPVNIYLRAERSIKYGILFIGLTFAAFFLVEILGGIRIHPLQYLFVGLGLSIFFLLLMSMAEHIPFHYAYLIAASACIGLLAYYCRYVLHSRSGALILGGALAVLYGALYVITGSEDHALLMGSGLLFFVLAGIMILTRRIEWYDVEYRYSSK